MLKKISQMFSSLFSSQPKSQSHISPCVVGDSCPKCNEHFDKHFSVESESMITCSICGLRRPAK